MLNTFQDLFNDLLGVIDVSYLLGVISVGIVAWSRPHTFIRAIMSILVAIIISLFIGSYVSAVMADLNANNTIMGTVLFTSIAATVMIFSVQNTPMILKGMFAAVTALAVLISMYVF